MVRTTPLYTRVGRYCKDNSVVPGETYTVIINGAPYSFPTDEEGTTPEGIVAGLANAIPSNFNPVQLKTSIGLSSTSTFTLEVKDTKDQRLMNAYQDTVLNTALLANPSVGG